MAKRRGYGEGSISQRANGSYRAQVSLEGRRISKTFKTKREAQDWIRDTLNKIDQGLTYDGTKVKLGDYLAQWLTSMKHAVRPTTHEHYTILVEKHLQPALGNILIRDLRPDRIQHTYDEWVRAGLGIPTIRKIHNVLGQALRRATQTGLIEKNPAALVKLPKSIQKEMSFWSEEEANRFLVAASGHRLYALFYLAIITGARESELLALRWEDLDWNRGTLHIFRQVNRHGEFVPVKTKATNRTLQLGKETLAVLRKRLEIQQLERKFALSGSGKHWQEHDLIFTSTIGTPIQQRNLVNRYFKPLVLAAGVPLIRFHDLRHTAVAIMLSRGVPVFTVSKWLGHGNPSITSDTYGHLMPGAMDGIGQMMDELVAPSQVEIKN